MLSSSSSLTKPPSQKKTVKGLKISNPQPVQLVWVADFEKFPSRSPSLHDNPRGSHYFNPLESHLSPEPSTSADPQIPSPSIYPAPLDITKTAANCSIPPKATTLLTSDDFVEVSVQGEDSRADSPKHYSTEAPPSFVKEVNEIVHPDFTPGSLSFPDSNSGVDEVYAKFEGQDTPDFDTSKSYSLSSDPNRNTGAWIEFYQKGPFWRQQAPIDEQVQDQPVSPNFNQTQEQPPSDMIERHRAQNRQDLALYLYAFITSTIAVAALVLAALAIGQIKSLKVPPGTLLLGSVPLVSSMTSSDIHAPYFPTSTPSPAHDWSGLSLRMRHASVPLASTPTTRNIADMAPTQEMIKRNGCNVARQEAIAEFEWPTNDREPTNDQTTTTITITSTIHATPTGHIAPRSPRILAYPRTNIATRRYVAPLSWSNLKRWLANSNNPTSIPSSVPIPDATHYAANPRSEHLVHRAIANAATPRMPPVWAWPHHSKRDASTNPPTANRTYTLWEAYSTIQLQATQLCFAKANYMNGTRTPSSVRNAADDEMAAELDKAICKGENATWPALREGGRCEEKDEWIAVLEKVKAFCEKGLKSNIIGQSVKLLCEVAKGLKGSGQGCERDGGGELAKHSKPIASMSRRSEEVATSKAL
jgi:hypothetical protein